MDILKICIAKLISKPAGTALSVGLFAVGVVIISLIINFEKAIQLQLHRNLAGIDLVVGAKGSPLQLILSSVFHIDAPTGNISLAEADQISRNPMVEKTIPLALGDNYRGFRIIGTNQDYPALYEVKLRSGSWFSVSGEAVLGWEVARKSGLGLGDNFSGVHGLHEQGHSHDYFLYTVKGIMEKSHSVMDNLILTPVESVWDVHGHKISERQQSHEDCDHEHDHDHAIDEEPVDPDLQEIIRKVESDEELSREEMLIFSSYKNLLTAKESDPSEEITALLFVYNSAAAGVTLPRLISESTNLQAAVPAIELNRLWGLLGYGFDMMQLLAWIIIVISGANILVHLLNTLSQNRSEIALLRVLGTPPYKVFLVLLLQGLILALSGWLTGMVITRVLWMILPGFIGFDLQFLPGLSSGEVWLLFYTILTGIAGALLPAVMAYRVNIHTTLNNS